jgi:hypothetical protein
VLEIENKQGHQLSCGNYLKLPRNAGSGDLDRAYLSLSCSMTVDTIWRTDAPRRA